MNGTLRNESSESGLWLPSGLAMLVCMRNSGSVRFRNHGAVAVPIPLHAKIHVIERSFRRISCSQIRRNWHQRLYYVKTKNSSNKMYPK